MFKCQMQEFRWSLNSLGGSGWRYHESFQWFPQASYLPVQASWMALRTHFCQCPELEALLLEAHLVRSLGIPPERDVNSWPKPLSLTFTTTWIERSGASWLPLSRDELGSWRKRWGKETNRVTCIFLAKATSLPGFLTFWCQGTPLANVTDLFSVCFLNA